MGELLLASTGTLYYNTMVQMSNLKYSSVNGYVD